jgi:hypothetical protein
MVLSLRAATSTRQGSEGRAVRVARWLSLPGCFVHEFDQGSTGGSEGTAGGPSVGVSVVGTGVSVGVTGVSVGGTCVSVGGFGVLVAVGVLLGVEVGVTNPDWPK